jgi:hypothetical protein
MRAFAARSWPRSPRGTGGVTSRGTTGSSQPGCPPSWFPPTVFYLDGPAGLLTGGLARQIAGPMPRLAADAGRQFPWLLAGGTLLTSKEQRVGQDASPAELEPLLAALAVLAGPLAQHEWVS